MESDILSVFMHPRTLTVHRDLLCYHSRYFHTKLGRPLDNLAMTEILFDIEKRKDEVLQFDVRPNNPLLQEKDVPPGYIPSWFLVAMNYQEKALNFEPEETLQEEVRTISEVFQLDEYPDILAVFVHWLYTQKLVLDDRGPERLKIKRCVLVYALAERLDVPLLRRECYNFIRGNFQSTSIFPDLELMQIIIQECSATCTLRNYFVTHFGHGLITQTLGGETSVLDHCPAFAAQVASEVILQLRKKRKSRGAFLAKKLKADESDSEYDNKHNVDASNYSISEFEDADIPIHTPADSESEFDSECLMDLSDDEDIDSLAEELEIARQKMIKPLGNAKYIDRSGGKSLMGIGGRDAERNKNKLDITFRDASHIGGAPSGKRSLGMADPEEDGRDNHKKRKFDIVCDLNSVRREEQY